MTDAEKLRRLRSLIMSLSDTYSSARDELITLIDGALA